MAPASHRLIVRTGSDPGMVFDLTKEVTMLGRDVTNDIVAGDAEISRHHTRITRTPGDMVLEDLGSTNGPFINGDRLVSPRVLASGDMVGMGENVTMTFESTAPEAAATVMGPARGAQARTAPPAPTLDEAQRPIQVGADFLVVADTKDATRQATADDHQIRIGHARDSISAMRLTLARPIPIWAPGRTAPFRWPSTS